MLFMIKIHGMAIAIHKAPIAIQSFRDISFSKNTFQHLLVDDRFPPVKSKNDQNVLVQMPLKPERVKD